MEPLTIRLLGSPQVTVGEQFLSFPTRKVLAMLVYLVVEGGRPSRETLMALLWPESAPEKAALTLRGTLSRLRRSLQPAGDLIISDGGKVGFDFAKPSDIDLARLAMADQPENTLDELRCILALDRGEFLEGFTLPDAPGFDSWATIQREACQRQLDVVYDRYSQHLLAIHDNTAAVSTAARWVSRSPFSEQAYRRLMAAQALNGQRLAALQTYEQLRVTLRQELGVEPSRETVVLADSIGRGRIDEELHGPAPMAGAASTEIRGRRLTLPLVGRAAEHGRLVTAFHQAVQEGAQLVALIGAAGVGKTRLVSAFREWAKLDSPEVEIWQGRAFETGGRLAYHPVVEAMRPRLEAVNAPEDLLEDVWLAELSQLMPELRARYPDLPPPLTGDAHFIRARLFEAVALLCSALARGRTAVLVLDDMQWADADTLDLIHYLARRWTELGAPIMLLLTVRQEAYAADAALREWLTSLGRDASLKRLLLDSLSAAAVEQLINRLSGESLGQSATDFAAWLWAETRGLPFFIEALLQMLIEQDILPVTDKGQPVYDFAKAMEHVRSVAQVPLPPGVRDVIQARLGQQSKEAGALLLAAAVLGRTCTFERLCQVADLSETEALEALEALLDGRLLTERPSDRQPYTLAHDYIREVVYGESREARRRVFHRRALLALEAADAPAAECAFHALAALLDEPAFRYSVAAGHEAFASYATQEALGHFNTALGVASRMQDRGETIDANLLGRLYQERGRALVLISDDEAVESNYEAMRALAVQRQDQTLEMAALLSLSNLYGQYTSLFNPLKAREMAHKALALALKLVDKAAESRSLWGLMLVELTAIGDNNLGMTYGRQALALARELGLKELVGHILNGLCWPLFNMRQIEEAREALSEAQSIWRELGNLQRLAEASRFMAIINQAVGDHRRILAKAPELVELGAAIGSRFDMAQGSIYLAIAHARQGRLGQALAYTEEVRALSAAIGHAMDEHLHQYTRIELYLAVGSWAEADRWADSLYAQRETMVPATIHLSLAYVALAKIAYGKLEEGQAILDELLPSLPADHAASFAIIPIAIAYGHLHLAQGKPEALFAGLEEQVQPYREAGFVRLLADAYWLRGRAEMALGHLDNARETLLKAKIVAEAQEERVVLWQILVSMAEVEEACGDGEMAARLRDEARVVVGYITENAGELRNAFMSQQAVVQLLGET
ncbi:MAG: BTAD domain-containing putative transcriptional regulator [Candidatus Promineifilaceae bacterium]|nr:BTAD domain-containing putative transcriptional regulator [Candidatus Promineifilaceae bacterium]